MSGGFVHAAATHLAPTPGNGRQLLTDAGGAETATTTLEKGRYATLLVGDEDVCIEFRRDSATPLAHVDPATSPLFKAGVFYHWLVEDDSKVVVAQAADGASAYKVWVWSSSKRV